jgi:hypothetical protein
VAFDMRRCDAGVQRYPRPERRRTAQDGSTARWVRKAEVRVRDLDKTTAYGRFVALMKSW